MLLGARRLRLLFDAGSAIAGSGVNRIAVGDQLAGIVINIAADTGLTVTAYSGQRAGTGSLSMAVQLFYNIQKDSVRCCQRMSVSEDEVDRAC